MVNEYETFNNEVSWKFFPCEQPGEKNGQEKSLGSEFKLSINSISSTKTPIKIVP